MDRVLTYNGSLTREQFLFYEIRIAAKLYLRGIDVEQAIREVKEHNLFQFPTEREINSITRACFKRLEALDNINLVNELAFAPASIAKQINLYAIMRSNALVWDFMIQVIAEKYQNQDLSYSRKDLNVFFTRLQSQNDTVSQWSESTLSKIKSVLTKMLVEAEYLESFRDTTLHPVLICEELEEGIRANEDYEVLPAFNRFV